MTPVKRINLELTPTLTYILGVCLGDGSVWKYTVKRTNENRYLVSLRATDITFVTSFKKALENIGLHVLSRIIHRKSPYHSLYVAEAYSKMFYDWFSSLNLEKIEHLLSDRKNLIIPFIRGFYESEGNYKLINGRYPYCRMFNSSKELLELLRKILEKIGFKSKIYDNYKGFHNQTIYCLAILGGAEETEKFLQKICPVCKIPVCRKPLIMRKPHWKSEEIEILKKYYGNREAWFVKSQLPNRSFNGIYHKAARLKLEKRGDFSSP